MNQYDDFLEHIRDSMEKMEGKTESLETVNNNNALLLGELNNVINKLQINYDYQVISVFHILLEILICCYFSFVISIYQKILLIFDELRY